MHCCRHLQCVWSLSADRARLFAAPQQIRSPIVCWRRTDNYHRDRSVPTAISLQVNRPETEDTNQPQPSSTGTVPLCFYLLHLSIHPSISILSYIHLSITIHSSLSPSCPHLSIYICPSTHLSVYLSIYISLSTPNIHLYIYPFVYPSI